MGREGPRSRKTARPGEAKGGRDPEGPASFKGRLEPAIPKDLRGSWGKRGTGDYCTIQDSTIHAALNFEAESLDDTYVELCDPAVGLAFAVDRQGHWTRGLGQSLEGQRAAEPHLGPVRELLTTEREEPRRRITSRQYTTCPKRMAASLLQLQCTVRRAARAMIAESEEVLNTSNTVMCCCTMSY